MAIGSYTTDDGLQNWYVSSLPTARALLSSFNNLNMLFNNFAGYETKKYKATRNIVLLTSLPDVKGPEKTTSRQMLAELEKLVTIFNINGAKNEKYNDFRSRLTSDDYYQSLSAFTELHIAGKLAERVGLDNVQLFPSLANGKNSDILVNVSDKRVFFEVVNLGLRRSEEKINNVIKKAAEYIGKKISLSDCYLQAEIDTAKLVLDANGNIDEEASIELLCREADRLAIHKLADFRGLLDLHAARIIISQLDLMKKYRHTLNQFDKDLLDLLESQQVKEWLESINSIEKDTPYTSFIGTPCRGLLVEIHTMGVYPSSAAKAEQVAFIEQIKRAVKSEVKDEQVEDRSPNVIVVQGTLWTLFSFEESMFDFEPIRRDLDGFLAEDNLHPFVSGILLFSKNFDNARFIPNLHADNAAKLEERTLQTLGIRMGRYEEDLF